MFSIEKLKSMISFFSEKDVNSFYPLSIEQIDKNTVLLKFGLSGFTQIGKLKTNRQKVFIDLKSFFAEKDIDITKQNTNLVTNIIPVREKDNKYDKTGCATYVIGTVTDFGDVDFGWFPTYNLGEQKTSTQFNKLLYDFKAKNIVDFETLKFENFIEHKKDNSDSKFLIPIFSIKVQIFSTFLSI